MLTDTMKKFLDAETITKIENAEIQATEEVERVKQVRNSDIVKIENFVKSLSVVKNFVVRDGELKISGQKNGNGNGTKLPSKPLHIDGALIENANKWYRENGGETATNGNTGKDLTVSKDTVALFAKKQGHQVDY